MFFQLVTFQSINFVFAPFDHGQKRLRLVLTSVQNVQTIQSVQSYMCFDITFERFGRFERFKSFKP